MATTVCPNGLPYVSSATFEDHARYSSGGFDAAKAKMGIKAMESNPKEDCHNNSYSVTVSSLATQACQVPRAAPAGNSRVKSTCTVQHLQRQLLLAVQRHTQRQFAGAQTSSTSNPALQSAAASCETVRCGAIKTQPPCSRMKSMAAHSLLETSADFREKIAVTARLLAEQEDNIEGSESLSSNQLKQQEDRRLPPQRLQPVKQEGAVRVHASLATSESVDTNVQSARTRRLAEIEPATDQNSALSLSAADCRCPSPKAACALPAMEHSGMASMTAAFLRALNCLRGPDMPTRHSLCTQDMQPAKEQCYSSSRVGERSDSTNGSVNTGENNNAGSNTGATQHVTVARDAAQCHKVALPVMQCKTEPFQCPRTVNGGLVDGSSIVGTRERVLLLYARLLKALLRDVASRGSCNVPYGASGRPGPLEDTTFLTCRGIEVSDTLAASQLRDRQQAIFAHEQGPLLEAGTYEHKQENHIDGGHAPHQQRPLQLVHHKRKEQSRASNLLHLSQAGQPQGQEVVEDRVCNDCMSHCHAEAAAVERIQVKKSSSTRKKVPGLYKNHQSNMATAVTECIETKRERRNFHNADHHCLRIEASCAPRIPTHDQEMFQLLLNTQEYLKQICTSASNVFCEKTGKTRGACASPGQLEGGQDCLADAEGRLQRRHESGSQTVAHSSNASASVQFGEAREKSPRRQKGAAYPAAEAAQERRNLPRSKPLNPNAAPFVPRLALSSSIGGGVHPTLTSCNTITPAENLQPFTASFPNPSIPTGVTSGCPDAWTTQYPLSEKQSLREASSLETPSEFPPATSAATVGMQAQKHQGSTMSTIQAPGIDHQTYEQQSNTTVGGAFLEKYLQRVLLQYMQHNSVEGAPGKLRGISGRSTLTSTGTSLPQWAAQTTHANSTQPHVQSGAARENEPFHLERQRRTQGLPSTAATVCRPASRTPPNTHNTRIHKETQGLLLQEGPQGSGNQDKAFVMTAQNVGGLPSSGRSDGARQIVEPTAALQQLLLYFRRDQSPNYLVASNVLQHLAASMRHPYSSPLPPAPKVLNQLRSASESVPEETVHATATSATPSKDGAGRSGQKKMQAALATARSLLQATAREQTVYRAANSFDRPAVANPQAPERTRASRRTAVPPPTAPDVRGGATGLVVSRLADGRMDRLMETGTPQQLQHPQRQDNPSQRRQSQALELTSQNNSREQYQAALQAALTSLLRGGAEARSVQEHFFTKDKNFWNVALNGLHVDSLLQQLKQLRGLAKAQHAQYNCDQRGMETGHEPHSQVFSESERPTGNAVSLIRQQCETVSPSSRGTASTGAAHRSANAAEEFSQQRSMRTYTKLEMLQCCSVLRKRGQLLSTRDVDGMSQSDSTENILFFKTLPVPRNLGDSGRQYRTYQHQYSARQQYLEETYPRHHAASNDASFANVTRNAGKHCVHTPIGTQATSFPLSTRLSPRNVSPREAVDRPSPPKTLRYILSPKNGSDHSSTSTGDSTLTHGATLKNGEMSSGSVAFPTSRADVSRSFSLESWNQFTRADSCVPRLPRQHSADCVRIIPQNNSSGAAKSREAVQVKCSASPSSARCGPSRHRSVLSAALMLHETPYLDGPVQQPHEPNNQTDCSDNRQGEGNCQLSQTQPSPEPEQSAETALKKPVGTEATVEQPNARKQALSTSARDSGAVDYNSQEQKPLLRAPSSEGHDSASQVQGVTSSAAVSSSNRPRNGDDSGLVDELLDKQESVPPQLVSSSSSKNETVITPRQRITCEGADQHGYSVKEQQVTAHSPDTAIATAKTSARQSVAARHLNPAAAKAASGGPGNITETSANVSQPSFDTTCGDELTHGEASASTQETRECRKSGSAQGAGDSVVGSVDIVAPKTSRTPQSPQLMQSANAGRNYLLADREMPKSEIDQLQRLASLRAPQTSAAKTLVRQQQMPAITGLTRSRSKKVNSAPKKTSVAQADEATARLPGSTLCGYTTQVNSEDADKGSRGPTEACQNTVSSACRATEKLQITQSSHHAQSQQATLLTTGSLHAHHCGITKVEEVPGETAKRVSGGQRENQNISEKEDKHLDSEGTPHAARKGQSVSDPPGSRPAGDGQTTDPIDSGCSTTTAEVAPFAAAGAQDHDHSSSLKLKGLREIQPADTRATGVFTEGDCVSLQVKQQECHSPKQPVVAAAHFGTPGVQRPKQLSKARDELSGALLTPGGNTRQPQKKEKREMLQRQPTEAERAPKKHPTRDADTTQKRKCTLYVKKREQTAQGRAFSYGLTQQQNAEHRSLQIRQGKRTASWAVTARAAGAAAMSGAKPSATETGSITTTKSCRYVSSIQNDTLSGERW